MPPVDETHTDLLRLVERDFGELSEVGNKIAVRLRQNWKKGDQSSPPPPSSWTCASSAAKGKIEETLIKSWMQHRARLIPPRRRQVLLSDRAKADAIRFPVVYEIVDQVCRAGDATPYLSRDIFKNKGWNHTTDPLFSAFQLSHFHLGNFFTNPKMAFGTKELLFGTITRDHFRVIGVFDHDFGSEELLQEWIKSFPDDFLQLERMGKNGESFTFNKMRTFAKNGVNVSINVNGQTWMLKSGVTVGRHAGRILNYYLDMRHRIAHIKTPRGPVTILPRRIGVNYRPSGEFDIYDKDLGHLYFTMVALE